MARTQSADYAVRRDAITREAARLYAQHGFLGASVAQVAAACETSKSLIYHYYPSKEDILFAVMDTHVQRLVRAARRAAEEPGDARARLSAAARALVIRYEGAGDYQRVLLNELRRLPDEKRAEIVAHQRELLDIVDALILGLKPALAGDQPRRRALTMLFFGMINWMHTWFDPDGAIDATDVADMAATMLVAGVEQAAD